MFSGQPNFLFIQNLLMIPKSSHLLVVFCFVFFIFSKTYRSFTLTKVYTLHNKCLGTKFRLNDWKLLPRVISQRYLDFDSIYWLKVKEKSLKAITGVFVERRCFLFCLFFFLSEITQLYKFYKKNKIKLFHTRFIFSRWAFFVVVVDFNYTRVNISQSIHTTSIEKKFNFRSDKITFIRSIIS